jgi:hypothetical protein
MSTAAAVKRTAEQVLGKDKIISSDSHIMEPPDLWEANLTPSLKPKFPKFPPRNTATAGVGEALNAAIAIKEAQGLPVDQDKARLRDLLGFLLRAQWSEAGCYACRNPRQVLGGFSQQLASPSIRIDYVQHAMAAIGHGSRLLDDLKN